MLKPVLVTAPSEYPVTLAEAKAQSRVSHDLEDSLITSYIHAATAHLDGYSGILGRALVYQTWSVSTDSFSGLIRLPLPDVSSVTITYFDLDGVEQTVSSGEYRVLEDDFSPFIEFDSEFSAPAVFDRSDAVKLTFTCGYGDADDVPESIKHAILLMVGGWSAHRASMSAEGLLEIPLGVDALCAPYRRAHV